MTRMSDGATIGAFTVGTEPVDVVAKASPQWNRGGGRPELESTDPISARARRFRITPSGDIPFPFGEIFFAQ
ncbi:hypothetical protein GCM10009803_09990 [Microbacterium ginsengiterrae]